MSEPVLGGTHVTGTASRLDRRILAAIWLFSAIGSLVAALYLLWDNWIGFEWFRRLVAELSQTYLVYLTTILVFTFSHRRPTVGYPVRHSIFLLALGLSVGFNILVLGAIISVALDLQNVEEIVLFIELVSSYVSPFIAPAVAFFFTKSEPSE